MEKDLLRQVDSQTTFSNRRSNTTFSHRLFNYSFIVVSTLMTQGLRLSVNSWILTFAVFRAWGKGHARLLYFWPSSTILTEECLQPCACFAFISIIFFFCYRAPLRRKDTALQSRWYDLALRCILFWVSLLRLFVQWKEALGQVPNGTEQSHFTAPWKLHTLHTDSGGSSRICSSIWFDPMSIVTRGSVYVST